MNESTYDGIKLFFLGIGITFFMSLLILSLSEILNKIIEKLSLGIEYTVIIYFIIFAGSLLGVAILFVIFLFAFKDYLED